MDQHLYQLASEGQLSPQQLERVYALAVQPGDPAQLDKHLRRGIALVAALLLGAGLIFWIAANWQEQTRWFKLGLIEAALALCLVLALLLPKARLAALLGAQLALGGLLAFVGQTYQTGADAWQLFAAWAVLSLLWTALARSDGLWTLWVLIVAMGLVSWSGRVDLWMALFGRLDSIALQGLTMVGWLLLALIPLGVSQVSWLRVHRAEDSVQGLGRWSHRVAMGLALSAWAIWGAMRWFELRHAGWLVVLLSALLVGSVFWLSLASRWRDYVVLCLATLAVDVLLLAAVARLAVELGGITEGLLFFSLAALLCLGASVTGLMRMQRRWSAASVAVVDDQEGV